MNISSGCTGNDLAPYHERLTKRSIANKFVKCHTYKKPEISQWGYPTGLEEERHESWCGDWIVDGVPCFLVILDRWQDDIYIWCCGNDDFAMEYRDFPSVEAAMEVYEMIFDGVSKKELESIGFTWA